LSGRSDPAVKRSCNRKSFPSDPGASEIILSGAVEEGLAALTEALNLMATTDVLFCHAELLRLKGELFLKRDEPNQAEASFREAINVAEIQHAKLLELRASMSLARLWRDQGKVQQARELLAPVYGWFTEGFDTRDLKEAKALLDQLPS
jgi:predicted ATPase